MIPNTLTISISKINIVLKSAILELIKKNPGAEKSVTRAVLLLDSVSKKTKDINQFIYKLSNYPMMKIKIVEKNQKMKIIIIIRIQVGILIRKNKLLFPQ